MDNEEKKKATQVLVNRRNSETVKVMLNEMSQKIREQNKTIETLDSTMNQLNVRISELEMRLNLTVAKHMGSGPTTV